MQLQKTFLEEVHSAMTLLGQSVEEIVADDKVSLKTATRNLIKQSQMGIKRSDDPADINHFDEEHELLEDLIEAAEIRLA